MKLVASKVVAGVAGVALVTGAIVWNGSRTIENAKTFVAGANTKLEAYQANETKLIAGIEAKNTEIAGLKKQIETLNADAEANATEIARLEGEVEALEAEKASLEEQLNNAGTNNESLLAEITRLEGEINKANEQVAGLQTELDKVSLDSYTPTSSDEIDRLLGGEEAPETITYSFNSSTGWTTSNVYANITDTGYVKGKTLSIKNNTENTIKVTLHQKSTGSILKTITIEAGMTESDIMTSDSDGIYGIKVYDNNENLLVEGTR